MRLLGNSTQALKIEKLDLKLKEVVLQLGQKIYSSSKSMNQSMLYVIIDQICHSVALIFILLFAHDLVDTQGMKVTKIYVTFKISIKSMLQYFATCKLFS